VSGVRRQIRIFICDDAPELRELTRHRLEWDPALSVVGEAGDGEAAVALIAQLCPDVVMLDLSMPNVDGLEALPRVRDAAPSAGVIVSWSVMAAPPRTLPRRTLRFRATATKRSPA